MHQFFFIVNPVAGRRANGRTVETILKRMEKSGASYELVYTTGTGSASTLARTADAQVVVAVGGDGTVNEVGNGLVGSQKALGVIPIGSGNDFVKAISVTRDQAESILLSGKRKRIDVGLISVTKNGSEKTSRYFLNGVGIGFDAAVANRTKHIKHLRGTLLYIVAVLQTLGKYEAPSFSVHLDGSALPQMKNLLISIGNGQCAGGGFYLTPDAMIDDGVLDICMIRDISIGGILRIMPKVMRGKHRSSESVSFHRARKIAVSADRGFHIHADGEIVGENVREVEIEVCSAKLNVVVGG